VNRTFRRAILLSLAMHALLLFGWSVERITARREAAPPPLEARLVEPPAPPTPPPPPTPPQKVEPVKPPPPVAKKRVPRRKPPVVAKPEPKPEPRPETEPEALAQPSPLPEPPATAPAPPVIAKVEPRPAPPQPSPEHLEALTRDQYRLAVLNAARAHNRYPPLARENNWEGEVRVRMEIGADGTVAVRVEKSSGHPILDRQAMEMFRRAQAQVPLPAALRGKPLSFELRAIYNLKDQASG
jgi:protein TonB